MIDNEDIVSSVESAFKSYLAKRDIGIVFAIAYESEENIVLIFKIKDNKQAEKLLGLLPPLEDIFYSLYARRVTFQLQGYEPSPSRLEILSVIKIRSPLKPSEILSFIDEEKKQTVEWMRRELDALRKQRLVARISDDKYILMPAGQVMVGTSTGRNSSDVARALVLNDRNG